MRVVRLEQEVRECPTEERQALRLGRQGAFRTALIPQELFRITPAPYEDFGLSWHSHDRMLFYAFPSLARLFEHIQRWQGTHQNCYEFSADRSSWYEELFVAEYDVTPEHQSVHQVVFHCNSAVFQFEYSIMELIHHVRGGYDASLFNPVRATGGFDSRGPRDTGCMDGQRAAYMGG